MTDSPFDDSSFLDNLPDGPGHETEDHPGDSVPPPPTFQRFNDQDMLSEAPKEDAPLYPEMLTPQQDVTAPKRPLPWFIDIFLYPINKTGIINLAVTFGVPVVLIGLTLGCIAGAKVAPLLIIVAVVLVMSAIIATILMCLYFGWFVTECVRSSSEGNIRAPDTIGQTPGMLELFALGFQVFLCAMVFLGMSWSVHASAAPPDWVQQLLDTGLALLLPMTLLSIISLDSIRGLNPLLNLKLICLTLLPYLGMAVPLCLAHKTLFSVCLKMPGYAGIMSLALFEVYGAMVSAHVLGRFAWKQRDKPIWE
ncbi:MAG: hypothetical protein GY809_11155 [Planctomycetes bacterium]|nr:hypothetical protein [Planctomycetota bacterium]